MTFVWMSRSPSTRMFSLSATNATPAKARPSRMVALTQRPAEPREFVKATGVAASKTG